MSPNNKYKYMERNKVSWNLGLDVTKTCLHYSVIAPTQWPFFCQNNISRMVITLHDEPNFPKSANARLTKQMPCFWEIRGT